MGFGIFRSPFFMQTFPYPNRLIVRKAVRKLNTEHACNNLEPAIRKYGHRVQSLAFVFLKNKFDAEDAAQEVFLTYLRKAPYFLSAQKEKSWLMTVTANQCRDMLRAKHREELPLTEDLSYMPPQESDVLRTVLELEEIYRVPIHLHYYEGYSIKEIAAVLHVRPGTVGSRLSRGREMLKQRLGGEL